MATGLTPWEPFRDIDRILRRFEPIARTLEVSAPAVEVCDEGDHYRVRAEIPGVPVENVEIFLSGNLLTLRGEKRTERHEPPGGEKKKEAKEQKGEEKQSHPLYTEISYGSFERALTLPDDIDPEQVDASGKDGVLSITVGKRQSQRAKRINVRSERTH